MYHKPGQINWAIIIIYLLLVCLGWMSIYSSSYSPEIDAKFISMSTIHGKQLFFIISSLMIGLFVLLIDIKFITKLGYIIYFISIMSLILVLLIGKEVGGAKAWFDFGVFGLQPAEFAKFSTILAICKFMHEKNIYLNKIKHIIYVILFISLPFGLILIQPDAGSALGDSLAIT